LGLGKEEDKDGVGFDYDWFEGSREIKLLETKASDKVVLIDSKGKEVGVLEADGQGSMSSTNLEGDWKVV
jgi:hypothetical protein